MNNKKNERQLKEKLTEIREPDYSAEAACRQRWDTLAKPIDGLGVFEELIIRLAGIQRNTEVVTGPRAAVVLCADHGVVDERVTQTDSSVTASVARAVAAGTSTVNILAESAGTDVVAADFGMNRHAPIPGVIDCCVRYGTDNISKGPAMSREEACLAILRGIELTESLAEQGFRLLAAGEMGIGNTTPASAITAVLSGLDPSEVTGRGAGLPDEYYYHKIEIVRKAIIVNQPDRNDPLDILSRLGGCEIAGMTGLYIGGARTGTAIVIDGFLSAVAAFLAQKLCPDSSAYMIPAHTGREPACRRLMSMMNMKPVLDAGMALGEATGAVLLFPLLDAALSLYLKGETFELLHLEPYERYCQLC